MLTQARRQAKAEGLPTEVLAAQEGETLSL